MNFNDAWVSYIGWTLSSSARQKTPTIRIRATQGNLSHIIVASGTDFARYVYGPDKRRLLAIGWFAGKPWLRGREGTESKLLSDIFDFERLEIRAITNSIADASGKLQASVTGDRRFSVQFDHRATAVVSLESSTDCCKKNRS